jgi:hypothetical protein
MLVTDTSFNDFVIDIKKKIRLHQYEALKVVNRELITLNWEIGVKRRAKIPHLKR